jgi:hypothetical protein
MRGCLAGSRVDARLQAFLRPREDHEAKSTRGPFPALVDKRIGRAGIDSGPFEGVLMLNLYRFQ